MFTEMVLHLCVSPQVHAVSDFTLLGVFCAIAVVCMSCNTSRSAACPFCYSSNHFSPIPGLPFLANLCEVLKTFGSPLHPLLLSSLHVLPTSRSVFLLLSPSAISHCCIFPPHTASYDCFILQRARSCVHPSMRTNRKTEIVPSEDE